MKGTPNGTDKSKERGGYKKSEVPVKPQKPEKKAADVIADSPLAQPLQEDKKRNKDTVIQADFFPDPAAFLEESEETETAEDMKVQETKRLEKQSSEAAEVVHHQETAEQEVLLEETQPDSLTNEGKGILDFSLHRRFKRRKTGEGTKRKQSGRKIKRGEERAEGVGLAIS